MVGKHGIYKQINEGGLANESIFAVMLQTFKELTNPQTLINECSTVADWSRMSNPTSPYNFKDADDTNINIMKNLLKENKYTMFLRKVDKTFPNETLLEIMDYDFGHSYDILHNQAKKKIVNTFICCNNFMYFGFVWIPLFMIIISVSMHIW